MPARPVTNARTAQPWAFFGLLLVLSTPFWWIGAGGGRLPFATFLPVAALMTFVPMLAALVLVTYERGASGALALLRRALDFGRITGVGWVLGALLLMPAVFLLQYGALRLSGVALVDPEVFPDVEIAALFVIFFIGAIGEELGWQGYAFGQLSNRWGTLASALLLGVIWALWHVIPFLEMGRSATWIVWHSLGMIAMRVIIVWLFVNAGRSVCIAVLFHTMSNMPYGVFSNYGSYYDPMVTALILCLVVAAILLFRPGRLLGRAETGEADHD